MAILTGTVVSVHAGRNADMSKDEHPSWLVRSTG